MYIMWPPPTFLENNRIILGGLADWDEEFFQFFHVTHLLICAEELADLSPRHEIVPSSYIPLPDNPLPRDIPIILVKLHEGADIIASFLASHPPPQAIFVSCHSGINRSPSIVLAYEILYHRKTFIEAFFTLLRERDIVNPHDLYRQCLVALAEARDKK